MYPKDWGKKLSSHCRDAVVIGSGSVDRRYSDGYFYNSTFVNTELLQPNYIRGMLSVCKYVKPEVSFAEVLKWESSVNTECRNPQGSVKRVCKVKMLKAKFRHIVVEYLLTL